MLQSVEPNSKQTSKERQHLSYRRVIRSLVIRSNAIFWKLAEKGDKAKCTIPLGRGMDLARPYPFAYSSVAVAANWCRVLAAEIMSGESPVLEIWISLLALNICQGRCPSTEAAPLFLLVVGEDATRTALARPRIPGTDDHGGRAAFVATVD